MLANSRGFVGGYRTSYAGVSAAPLAVDANGQMQRDGWWIERAAPRAIWNRLRRSGKEAARRTLRRLGARRVPTQRVPIVFAPEVARSLIGSVFEAASGDSIWRHASFLAGKLGEQIAAPALTIVDDNTMLLPTGVGGFGTSPFDGEGLPSRRTVVVENGVLRNYLLNTYTARKLGMKSTHNASRGLAGTPGIGCGNLYLEPGTLTPKQIIAECSGGALRDQPDGLRHQYRDRRLLARRDRAVDRERPADARGRRGHDRRQSGRDAAQCDRDRQRPGVSRLGRFAHAAHRRHDDRGSLMRARACATALSCNRWPSIRPTPGLSAVAVAASGRSLRALRRRRSKAEPYIGRTPNLRGRLERLLQPSAKHPRRLQLAGRVRRIAWRLTGSEFESLLAPVCTSGRGLRREGLDRMHLRAPAFVRFLGGNPYPRIVVTQQAQPARGRLGVRAVSLRARRRSALPKRR